MKTLASTVFLFAMASTASAAFTGSSRSFCKSTRSSTAQRSTLTPQDFRDPHVSLLKKLNSAKKQGEPLIENILEPSYSVMLATAAAGPFVFALFQGSMVGVVGNLIHVLLATLLWVQTLRVRCVFEEDGFEFYNLKGTMDLKTGGRLTKKPSNFVTNTENKWSYDKVTGYQFFPSIELPLICYLKETQTPEKYNIPGEQPHFFPSLFNSKQFKEEMDKRKVPYGV